MVFNRLVESVRKQLAEARHDYREFYGEGSRTVETQETPAETEQPEQEGTAPEDAPGIAPGEEAGDGDENDTDED